MLLKKDDYIGIISCSDGIDLEFKAKYDNLTKIVNGIGLKVKSAETLYKIIGPFSGSPEKRANELMKFYEDESVKAIFDISGGDSANQILNFIDFNLIKENEKPFIGMSDISVLLNSINKYSGIHTYHYSIRNLIGEDSENQTTIFENTFMKGKSDAYNFDYEFIRGEKMEGVVIGGNIRCFLKLAGTKFLPKS